VRGILLRFPSFQLFIGVYIYPIVDDQQVPHPPLLSLFCCCCLPPCILSGSSVQLRNWMAFICDAAR
jgi:hypothetical protein